MQFKLLILQTFSNNKLKLYDCKPYKIISENRRLGLKTRYRGRENNCRTEVSDWGTLKG